MTLRFLFYLGHPAHYHNLKHSIGILLEAGHTVKVVARGKDVLFELLEREEWDLVRLPERQSKSRWGLVANIASRERTMLKIARRYRPHLMAGTDLVIAHIGKLLGIPSIIINEDDSAAVPLMAKYAFPFATAILAPNCCDQSPANHKRIGYEGYHELAYLHPDYFEASREDLPEALADIGKYFILRFASLNAHHDKGRKGINDNMALKLIEILSPSGRVFITSERPLSPELEPCRLPVHPADMHQVMAHASMYIGDSQTMAAEAAVLGVPSIRFNDFVGELSYLEELEHKYGLTIGIPTSDPERLLNLVRDWVADGSIKDTWVKRRAFMLRSTIDVTPLWVETFVALASRKR